MVTAWKKKKGKTSKFVMQEVTIGMREKGIICMGGKEKKNIIKTLGTERCENVDTLYIKIKNNSLSLSLSVDWPHGLVFGVYVYV